LSVRAEILHGVLKKLVLSLDVKKNPIKDAEEVEFEF
jgi:hypothetical protein